MRIREGCIYCGGSPHVTTHRMVDYFEGEYFIQDVRCADCKREWMPEIYCVACDLPTEECHCEEKAATEGNR